MEREQNLENVVHQEIKSLKIYIRSFARTFLYQKLMNYQSLIIHL
jgi:hypothetical protein